MPVSAVREAWAGRRGAGRRPLSGGRRGSALPVVVAAVVVGLGRPAVALPLAVGGGGAGRLAVRGDLVGPAGRRGQRLERRRVLPLAVGAALPGLPGLAEAVLGRAGRVRPLCGALAVALGLRGRAATDGGRSVVGRLLRCPA